jgi:hypothetical protein
MLSMLVNMLVNFLLIKLEEAFLGKLLSLRLRLRLLVCLDWVIKGG